MQVAWQVASERIEGVVHLQRLEDVLGEVGTEVLTAFLLYDLSEKGVVDVRILRSLTGRTALLSRLASCQFDHVCGGEVGVAILVVILPKLLLRVPHVLLRRFDEAALHPEEVLYGRSE